MNDGRQELVGTDPTRFTTEDRFAGHGRQFEKIPFGSVTGNPPAGHGLGAKGRWRREAKISNRLPRPAEPVSAHSVVKNPPACGTEHGGDGGTGTRRE